MASITHATVATGTDAGTGEIHKAQWNADHVITGLTGNMSASAATATSNTSVSQNTWTDVTGVSLSLAAGTYVIQAQVQAVPAANTSGVVVRLYDGTNVLAAMEQDVTTSGYYNGISLITEPVTFSTTTTVKVQAWFSGGGGGTVYASTSVGSSGNTVTRMVAISGGAVGGLVLLEQHTASSSATLDFTTFISSTYDVYKVVFTDIVAATSTADFLVQFGSGGGPTWDTGSNYVYACQVVEFGTGATGSNSSSTVAKIAPNLSTNAGYGFASGELDFHHLQSTVHRKAYHGTMNFVTATPQAFSAHVGGQWTDTSSVTTGLRFKMSSGNIASGTIRVYGLAK
jgi:hypothetical protein